MNKVLLFSLLIIINAAAFQSPEIGDPVADAVSLSTSNPSGSSAVFGNPAWLRQSGSLEASLSAAQFWDIKGLYLGKASVCVNRSLFAAGAGFYSLNADSIYNETAFCAGLAAGWRRLDAGAGFIIRCVSYGATDREWQGSEMVCGANFRIIKNLTACFSSRFSVSNNGETPLFRTGLCFEVPGSSTAGLELEYQAGWPLAVCAGESFVLVPGLTVKAGFRSEPLGFSAGISLSLQSLAADFSLRTNPDLGLYKSMGLRYRH